MSFARHYTYPLQPLDETVDGATFWSPDRYTIPVMSSGTHQICCDWSGYAAALAIKPGCQTTHYGDIHHIAMVRRCARKDILKIIDSAWMAAVHG